MSKKKQNFNISDKKKKTRAKRKTIQYKRINVFKIRNESNNKLIQPLNCKQKIKQQTAQRQRCCQKLKTILEKIILFTELLDDDDDLMRSLIFIPSPDVVRDESNEKQTLNFV